jgi:ribosomal protein S18 acetylase RimI-like enzyme
MMVAMVTEPLPTRVWHLAMESPTALQPASARDGVSVAPAEVPLGSLNRWLYAEIGASHAWLDRLAWDEARWQEHVEGVETLLVSVRGTPAGMAELGPHGSGGDLEIVMFGVLPAFHGRGAGGVLLTESIRRCWERGAARVVLHTCELDSPAALLNYQARGFSVVREAIEPRRRVAGPVYALRDARADEAADLELLQRQASLVWEEYRSHLEAAGPEIFALPAGGAVRVAVDEADVPLGFSAVVDRGDGAWELDGLFVEPSLHRSGVGRVLTLDVIARARAAGVARIDVVAGPARGFYERLGFAVVGDASTKFGPAFAMARAL